MEESIQPALTKWEKFKRLIRMDGTKKRGG